MNVRLLKAKRVENGLHQADIADLLGITPKSACEKENSKRCRFTVDEMLRLTERLRLTQREFDAIFFDGQLTECIRKSRQNNTL